MTTIQSSSIHEDLLTGIRYTTTAWFTSVLLIFSTVPARAGDKGSDEETFRHATAVLGAMVDSNAVSADLLSKADCVIVLPSVKKFAVGFGGSGGRGPMMCRGERTSAAAGQRPPCLPSAVPSAGFQVGGSSTDFVLVIMSAAGVHKVLSGKTKVGRDMTAAAGPSGATPFGSADGADILTYARDSPPGVTLTSLASTMSLALADFP